MRRPQPTADDLRILDPDGSFRDRLEADRAALAQINDTGDVSGLRHIVHGLAGAAGTFGYGELGDVAIEIDDRAVEGGAITAADLARLLAALEQALGKPEKSA